MPLGCRPLFLLVLLASVSLSGCSLFRKPAPPEPPKEQSDALIFEDVTLEQANEAGEQLWKLRAVQATYSQSGQQAKVQKPRGKFFRGKQELYEVESKEGEINQDGEIVFLRGDVVVQDLREGAVIKGDEAEWRPNEEILILRGNLVGTREALTLKAQEGTWQESSNQVSLVGAPTVVTETKQRLKFETEGATWHVPEQTVVAYKPLTLQQFAEKQPEQVTRTAKANQGELNLQTQSVVLRQAAHINFVEPPLDISGDALRWNPQQDEVVSEARVTVVDRAEQVTMAGDRATANITTGIVEFTGNVAGSSQIQQSNISADRLKWFSQNQDVEAEGNVRYVQAEPAMEVSGPTAVGNLNEEIVTMSGGAVKTTVIPLDE